MFSRIIDGETADLFMIVEQSSSAAFLLYRMYKEKEYFSQKQLQPLMQQANQAFAFKGNIYDMSYFWTNDTLPLNVIEALPNHIKVAIKENFNSLAAKGYVTLKADNSGIICTQKGIDLCNDHNFIVEACKIRMNICADIKKVVEQESTAFIFKGNVYDMAYFITHSNLTIAEIEALPPETKGVVKESIKSLAAEGYIDISADRSCIICTQKGINLCRDPDFIVAAQKVHKELIIDDTVINQAQNRKVTVSPTPTGRTPNTPEINFDDSVVSNTNEIKIEAAKKKVDVTFTEKAVQKSEEKTAETSLKKGSEAVALTSQKGIEEGVKVAAGASTMGIGAAAQVVYELAKGSFNLTQDKILK